MERVLINLNREIKGIENRSMQGLIESSIIVRRDMDQTPPLIPVDTGNLRASWFTTPVRKGTQQGLMVGFNANYAVFVHENVGAQFKRPQSGAKFFEASLKRNKQMILETIKQTASIKK